MALREQLTGDGLVCDSCGAIAPDVIGPILYGTEGWEEFDLDGRDDEKGAFTAHVLLCGGKGGPHDCAMTMRKYMLNQGPPPGIRTCMGGQDDGPTFLDEAA